MICGAMSCHLQLPPVLQQLQTESENIGNALRCLFSTTVQAGVATYELRADIV